MTRQWPILIAIGVVALVAGMTATVKQTASGVDNGRTVAGDAYGSLQKEEDRVAGLKYWKGKRERRGYLGRRVRRVWIPEGQNLRRTKVGSHYGRRLWYGRGVWRNRYDRFGRLRTGRVR